MKTEMGVVETEADAWVHGVTGNHIHEHSSTHHSKNNNPTAPASNNFHESFNVCDHHHQARRLWWVQEDLKPNRLDHDQQGTISIQLDLTSTQTGSLLDGHCVGKSVKTQQKSQGTPKPHSSLIHPLGNSGSNAQSKTGDQGKAQAGGKKQDFTQSKVNQGKGGQGGGGNM